MIAFISRQIRRLIAFVALAAMLIGTPYALYKLGGPLLPDHVPGLAEIWQRLTERDTGQVFLGFLVIVGFVAWAIFAITVLMEVASRIAHRPDWHLPGLHLPQSAAGLLVGMLIAGTIATSATPAIAASMPLLPHPAPVAVAAMASPFQSTSLAAHHSQTSVTTHPAAPVRISPRAAATGPTWTVSKGDNLWSIAEKTLGNGRRYGEIAALNEGHIQLDGRVLDSARFLLPGWILQLPAGAHITPGQGGSPAAGPNADGHSAAETVVVEPGDTLSQIALDELGDATLYPEIAAANHIANPDLIYSGQTIHIPASSAAAASGSSPSVTPSQNGAVGSAAGGVPDTTAGQAPTGDQAQAATAPGGEGVEPGMTAQTGDHGTGSSAPQSTATNSATVPEMPTATRDESGPTAGSSESAQAGATDSAGTENLNPPAGDQSESSSRHAALLAGATALLAAILWAGLLFTRRRLEQSRALGQRPRPPLELEARVDQAMRQAAAPMHPERVDATFRTATALLADVAPGGIAAAFIGAEAIELRPAVPGPPPPPCTGSDEAWILPIAANVSADGPDGEVLAALPALVTIGRTADGRDAAIDAEHVGALHVSGDPVRCRALINHMMVELSQSPWADGMQLVLPGAPEAVATLNPERIETIDAPSGAALALGAHLREIRALLGDESIASARTDSSRGEAWEPYILIADGGDLAGTPGIRDLVRALESGPAAATALITTGTDLGIAHRIVIDDEGMLRSPHFFGDTTIRVAGLTDDEFQAMLGLYSATLADASPGVLSQSPVGGEVRIVNGYRHEGNRADECDETAATVAAAPAAADAPAAGDGGTVAEGPPVAIVGEVTPGSDPRFASADRAQAVDGVSAVIPGARINGMNHAQPPEPAGDVDRNLDADLAEWHSPEVVRPKIGILGAAQVTGRGSEPKRRKSRLIEIAVYLALYSRGVSVEKFVSDLWPDSAPPESVTRRSIVSHLRQWLGSYEDGGGAFLPNADSGYLLVDRLLDSELFTRLVKRGDRRSRAGDARGALNDLLNALALVRGPVFPEAGGFPYSWLALPERMEDRTLPMQIVDAAHSAVDLALAQGDPDGADNAAAIARLVDPNSNIPMSDLIHIAQYRNDGEAAATWAKLTLQLNDLDLPEDLPATARDAVGDALPKPRRQHRPEPRT